METTIFIDEADLELVPSIRSKLEPIVSGPVVIDLSGVPYLTSSVLTELIRLRKRLPDTAIVLRSPRALTQRVLRTVSFDRLFSIEPGIARRGRN